MMRPDPRSGIRAYTQGEVDEMDIFYYISLLGKYQKQKQRPGLAQIDAMGYC